MLLTINYSVIYYLFLLLHLASSSPAVGAFIKEWRPVDTDWQNRLNWEGGRLPCPQSLVILPEEVVISVYVNGTAAWNTLVMPQTGELVLDDGFNLMDPTTPGSNCPPGEIHFKHWRPSSWFDPDQWQLSDPDGTIIRQPLAVPHSERIPCSHDSVHLSDRHSLSVDFDNVASITVGQIRYGEQTMTADELRNRLNGPEWRYQVHNPPRSVYLNGTECQDPLGCQCTGISDDVSKMQMVCSNAGTLCSNQLECPDGFRPPGHCCDMCGAMIKLTIDDKIFTKSALDRLVLSMFEAGDTIASGLMSYSYRTAANILHLTVVDNTTNEKSIALAEKLYTYLMKDRGNGNLYGIVALEMSHSGISYPASHHLTPEELHLIASNLATVFGTLVLIALAAVAYYVYRKKMRLSREDLNVSFARFENDRIEIGGIDDSFQEGMGQQQQRPPFDPSSGQSSGSSSSGSSGSSGRPITTVVPSPYAEEPVLPDTLPSPAIAAVLPSAWKKLRRSFVNPLFGDATVGHRMSGRWQMSTLMMTTSVATQENPVYDIDILPPTPPSRPAKPSDAAPIECSTASASAAVTPLTVDEVTTDDFPMAKLPHPVSPLVPHAPAGSPFEEADDVDEEEEEEAAEAINANDESIGNVSPQGKNDEEEEEVSQTDASTVATMSDDAPLVDSEPIKFKAESSGSSSSKSTGRIKNKPLKTLWKKATKKFSPQPSAPTITAAGSSTLTSSPETSLSSTSSTVQAEAVGGSEATAATAAAAAEESTEHKAVIRSSSSGQHQQQRDDEVQLTLNEETDE